MTIFSMFVRVFRSDGMSGGYDGWKYHGMTAEQSEIDTFITNVEADIIATVGQSVQTLEYKVVELIGTVVAMA